MPPPARLPPSTVDSPSPDSPRAPARRRRSRHSRARTREPKAPATATSTKIVTPTACRRRARRRFRWPAAPCTSLSRRRQEQRAPHGVLQRVVGGVLGDLGHADEGQHRGEREQPVAAEREHRQDEQRAADAEVLEDARHQEELNRPSRARSARNRRSAMKLPMICPSVCVLPARDRRLRHAGQRLVQDVIAVCVDELHRPASAGR